MVLHLLIMSFSKEGIVRRNTYVDRPQQNGLAERMNKTLLERARCMLSIVHKHGHGRDCGRGNRKNLIIAERIAI